MSVEVFTEGNRDLIKKYSSVIFLPCKTTELLPFNKKKPVTDIINHQNSEAIKAEARKYLQTMLSRKLGIIESHKDLNPYIMAAGERICLNYAYAFAVRKVLNLDLPLVMDSPYGLLDDELRDSVHEFLKEQPYQQIMLGTENEFQEEDGPHYILDYRNGYSKIVKKG
jgi:ABC-type nitrate/sulfonate/bicarbonate transport system ATPase subunit